jgi:exopolysaccharide/PEP-CTERM locus tyrosine autokinase
VSRIEIALQKALQKAQAKQDTRSDAAVPRPGAPERDPTVARPAPERDAQAAARPVQFPSQPARARITLDRDRLRTEGLLPPVDAERRLAEEYRRIKRPLIQNTQESDHAIDPRARLIMVASALPGEGKTFSSVNLALSLSTEKDVNVVLIDGDVAKPQLSDVLGLGDRPGLLDLLRDATLDAESLLVETDVPGLAVLGAGRRSDLATELLASHRMTELMRILVAADLNRLVVLDSPPLLVSNESRELSSVAGQIVLIVRAGVTPQAAVVEALARIGENKSIGLVLNQAHHLLGQGYYYGYGYGYGSGSGVETAT